MCVWVGGGGGRGGFKYIDIYAAKTYAVFLQCKVVRSIVNLTKSLMTNSITVVAKVQIL